MKSDLLLVKASLRRSKTAGHRLRAIILKNLRTDSTSWHKPANLFWLLISLMSRKQLHAKKKKKKICLRPSFITKNSRPGPTEGNEVILRIGLVVNDEMSETSTQLFNEKCRRRIRKSLSKSQIKKENCLRIQTTLKR